MNCLRKWDQMKTIEQILSQVPDKRKDKDTTSHKFKNDLYDFFIKQKNNLI